MMNDLKYCNSLTHYSRFATREVKVGTLGIGGSNPIRIQSMTTTDTMNTQETVAQSIRMIKAGCELVRITAPSLNEAQNLENIKNELRKQGFETPICADIHFTPNAAEAAARIVEKVRVNPGNYADKKKFEHIEYSDKSYDEELERIRERFLPLVKICKENGTAMRIGTNHGSLSDRILSRYGDTPLGMVESALEFVRICEAESYHEIILSMKASNPQVMVQAYRLLVNKMISANQNYPLHLGVTEAGDGEDGRIKSAIGIGALLEDGLGDTIRVSLTEEPEHEMPVAKMLAERYEARNKSKVRSQKSEDGEIESSLTIPGWYSPFGYSKRETCEVANLGGKNVPRVIADLSNRKTILPEHLSESGYSYALLLDKWNIADQACDFVFVGDTEIDFEIPGTVGIIYNSTTFARFKERPRCYPLFCGSEYFNAKEKSEALNFIAVDLTTLENPEFKIEQLGSTEVLIFYTSSDHGMAEQRQMFFLLEKAGCKSPVIIRRSYAGIGNDALLLYAATDLGALLLDGFGDGVWITNGDESTLSLLNSVCFGTLQGTRTRISKTEYISCPSCGRTLFDLQETTAKIRSRTSHLKGVKIGIMGCIVNGPGEMADADYGYVGTGVGKITLYKGREVVKRNIPSATAVDELISLIKDHGDWVEKAS